MATTAGMRLLLYGRLIVVEDRAEAAILGEQRIAAVAEQVQVERLVGLLLVVALDFNRDRLRRLAGVEGQRAGPGDVVAVAGLRGAVHGAERHRHGLIVGGRERHCQWLRIVYSFAIGTPAFSRFRSARTMSQGFMLRRGSLSRRTAKIP